MSKTYAEHLRTGGGRVEYVAHIHGMDWAICTHPDVVTIINANPIMPFGPAIDAGRLRRHLFGTYFYDMGGGAEYPCDDVTVVDGLDPPTDQTIRLEASQGALRTGPWSLQMRHDSYGITGARGLPGVHDLADPRFDGSIERAVLAGGRRKTDTTLTVRGDVGLHGLIDNNSMIGVATPIWFGQQCAFATAVGAIVDGEYSITIANFDSAQTSMAYRSRCSSILLDDFDGADIGVYSQPVGGVVGRPITLWALVLNEAGDDIFDVARARTGRVSTGLKSEDGVTTIPADGWTDWLRTPIQQSPTTGTLKGYLITRPTNPVAVDCAPHLVVHYASGAGPPWVFSTEHIWFCAAGDSMWFDTYEELIEHCQAELNAYLGGAGVYNAGVLTLEAMVFNLASTPATLQTLGPAWIGGSLAWYLCWGLPPASAYWYPEVVASLRSGFRQRRITSREWIPGGTNPSLTIAEMVMMGVHAVGSETIHNYGWHYAIGITFQMLPKSPYLYQFPWERLPAAELGEWVRSLEVAEHPDFPGERRLYFDDDVDTDYIAPGAEIQFGAEHVGKVFAVGADYVQLDSAPLDRFLSEAGASEALEFVLSTSTGGEHHRGDSMVWAIWAIGSTQPYAVSTDVSVRLANDDTMTPWFIFRALFGDPAVLSVLVSESIQADHIPDIIGNPDAILAANVAYDHKPTIAWELLPALWTAIVEGETYRLPVPERETLISKIFEGFLLSHGISPTWQYDARLRMWRMRFRALGILNATEAITTGRLLTDATIMAGRATYEHTRQNLYNRIDYKGWFDGADFKLAIDVPSQSAHAAMGGRRSTLEITDYITELPQEIAASKAMQYELKTWFANRLLAALSQPAATVSFDLLPSTLPDIGCGVVTAVTDDTTYDVFTGALGLADRGALCTEMRQRLYGASHRVTVQTAGTRVYGYSPALGIAIGDSAADGADAVTISTPIIDPADNVFTPVTGAHTDLAFFDCYVEIDGVLAVRPCACGDYHVIVQERDSTTPRVFRGVTISDVDPAAGTARLNLVDIGADWVADGLGALAWVIYFEDWDQGIEDCQRAWLFHADAAGELVDGAVTTPGRVWG